MIFLFFGTSLALLEAELTLPLDSKTISGISNVYEIICEVPEIESKF